MKIVIDKIIEDKMISGLYMIDRGNKYVNLYIRDRKTPIKLKITKEIDKRLNSQDWDYFNDYILENYDLETGRKIRKIDLGKIDVNFDEIMNSLQNDTKKEFIERNKKYKIKSRQKRLIQKAIELEIENFKKNKGTADWGYIYDEKNDKYVRYNTGRQGLPEWVIVFRKRYGRYPGMKEARELAKEYILWLEKQAGILKTKNIKGKLTKKVSFKKVEKKQKKVEKKKRIIKKKKLKGKVDEIKRFRKLINVLYNKKGDDLFNKKEIAKLIDYGMEEVLSDGKVLILKKDDKLPENFEKYEIIGGKTYIYKDKIKKAKFRWDDGKWKKRDVNNQSYSMKVYDLYTYTGGLPLQKFVLGLIDNSLDKRIDDEELFLHSFWNLEDELYSVDKKYINEDDFDYNRFGLKFINGIMKHVRLKITKKK